MGEGTAARSSRPIEREALMQQARKARAEHAVKCKLMLGKRISKKKKLLTELYANGSSIEDGGAWETESQRHCAVVHVDPEETTDEQKKWIMKYKEFTEQGRVAEITVDLVLQARAKMSENEVDGPEDAVVGEMIKQLTQEKHAITTCFSRTGCGDDAPSS